MTQGSQEPLAGRHVLIVEDQYLIATEMRRSVEALGGEVVGPCATVEQAIESLKAGVVEFALLDINLGGGQVFSLVKELNRRAIPFAFATGYEEWVIPPAYRRHLRLEKPVTPKALRDAAALVFPGA